MDVDAFLGPEYHPPNPSLLTYRLVGDNIDKNVKPHSMTNEHQTRSLHYFHSFTVRDCIDLSNYSNEPHVPDLTAMNLEELLPSSDDERVLHEKPGHSKGASTTKAYAFFPQICLWSWKTHLP